MDVIGERQHLFLGSRLKRLAEQMQGDVGTVAERAGIPIQPGQYPLLATLDEHGPQTIGDLALSMRMSQPAITKKIDRLVEAGLVDVSRRAADRRQRIASLSAAGAVVLERSKREVWPLVEAAVRELTDGLRGSLLEQVEQIEARLAARPLNSGPMACTEVALCPAADAELPAIAALMNLAYRGRQPDAGWTTEGDFIDGDRTSEALLRQDLASQPDAALLVWRRQGHHDPRGCVWLKPEGDGVWYLGSLTIHPREQASGLGRELLAGSEVWVHRRGGRAIRMTVIDGRESLIAWYVRRGYVVTGETEPFPYDDDRFGVPRGDGLHFVVLRKQLD